MSLTSGTRLGPYEIVSLLGTGGMGEVYRALDTRLHRTVALKVLPVATFHLTGSHERFLQEARAASALNHPNIVTIHDIARERPTPATGEVSADAESIPFLVMEYVPGQPLSQAIP